LLGCSFVHFGQVLIPKFRSIFFGLPKIERNSRFHSTTSYIMKSTLRRSLESLLRLSQQVRTSTNRKLCPNVRPRKLCTSRWRRAVCFPERSDCAIILYYLDFLIPHISTTNNNQNCLTHPVGMIPSPSEGCFKLFLDQSFLPDGYGNYTKKY
jgi:hypothetical protein